MEINKQNQTAGDNAQQVQVGDVTNLTIVNGITEQRARDIFREMNQQAVANYTQDAWEEALRRIRILETLVMEKVEKVDDVLGAFGDPAFQVLLAEAQKRAAATEREVDYKLLSELLVCHVKKGACRTNRAGINRAVEIVGDIDTTALCALTVAHAVESFFPITGEILNGLRVLDGMFKKLMYEDLPTGDRWLDHLDTLGAVRLGSFGEMKKLCEYYAEILPGYVCIGIKKESDEYKMAIDILHKAQVNDSILVDNECLEGYVRLNIRSKDSIMDLHLESPAGMIPLSDEQIDALEKMWEMYAKNDELTNLVKKKFAELLNGFETLKKLQQWWDSIPGCFDITQVGRVLAHTNAKRCDSNVPDLI